MSETNFLKLNKHDNNLINTNAFNIEKYLNDNWDTIDEHANNINDSIEKKSKEIEELQSENERLRNDLNSISIIGQASGENIDLNDSSGARLVDLKINGNHKQETRTGKNKIDLAKCQVKTYNGITSTYNEESNSITFNGTCTSDNTTFHIFENGENANENNVAIKNNSTLLAQYINGSANGYSRFKISDGNWQDKIWLDLTTLNSTNKKIYATYSGSDTTIKYLSFRFENGTVLDNFTVQLMLTDTVDTEYEQYGVSPSPDFPSEIETAGSNINLLENTAVTNTVNGVEFKVNSDGSVIANGTAATNVTFEINNEIQPKNISNLILSGCPRNGSNTTYDLKIELYKDNVWTAVLYDFGNGINTRNLSEYTSCSISITIRKGYNANNLIFKPKLEKGIVATPYSLYKQGSAEVKVVNKNFIKIDKTIDFSISNVQFTCKEGKVNLNGTSNANISSVNNAFKNYFRFVLPAGNYTYSQKNNVSSNIFTYILDFEDTSKRYATANGNSVKNASFTLEKATEVFVGMYSGSNVTFNNVEIELQIEKGSTATDFVEHQEQTITMPVQQEMLQGDYFDWDNEKEVHNWKKITLTGSESNVKTISGDSYNRFQLSLTSYGVRNYIYCTHYLAGNSVNSGELDISFDGKYIVIHSPSDEITTEEQFKTWLEEQYNGETPVTIYYKLATPIELNLTDEQKTVAKQIKETLHTYKNVTHIYSNNEVSPIIDIKYAKDLNTVINNMEAG